MQLLVNPVPCFQKFLSKLFSAVLFLKRRNISAASKLDFFPVSAILMTNSTSLKTWQANVFWLLLHKKPSEVSVALQLL